METIEGTLKHLIGDSEWIQGYREGLKACAQLDKEKTLKISYLELRVKELEKRLRNMEDTKDECSDS